MKSIKEAEKNEIENKNTEIEEDLTEEIITETQEEKIMPVVQELAEENSVNVQDKDKIENNTESTSLPEEDIKKAKVPATEKKPAAKTERTRPANYSSNRPKRFVVTNEPSAAKRDRSNVPESRRDRSVNRTSGKSSPDNSRKVNRNNNSASNSRGIREGSSLNRKNDSINKRKGNYNSTVNRNSAAVKDNRNNKK